VKGVQQGVLRLDPADHVLHHSGCTAILQHLFFECIDACVAASSAELVPIVSHRFYPAVGPAARAQRRMHGDVTCIAALLWFQIVGTAYEDT
jgi:hypothetical protein